MLSSHWQLFNRASHISQLLHGTITVTYPSLLYKFTPHGESASLLQWPLQRSGDGRQQHPHMTTLDYKWMLKSHICSLRMIGFCFSHSWRLLQLLEVSPVTGIKAARLLCLCSTGTSKHSEQAAGG